MSVASYASYTSDILPWDSSDGYVMGGGMPIMQPFPYQTNSMPLPRGMRYNPQFMSTDWTPVGNARMPQPMGDGWVQLDTMPDMPRDTFMPPPQQAYQPPPANSRDMGPFGGNQPPPGTNDRGVANSPFLGGGAPQQVYRPEKNKMLPSIKDNYSCGVKLRETMQGQGRVLYVARLSQGSSAAHCGMIQPGDFLTRIDGIELGVNFDTVTVRQMLCGMRGTMVSLGFRKPIGGDYSVDLSRNVRSVKKTADAVLNKAVAWMQEVSNPNDARALDMARGFGEQEQRRAPAQYGGLVSSNSNYANGAPPAGPFGGGQPQARDLPPLPPPPAAPPPSGFGRSQSFTQMRPSGGFSPPSGGLVNLPSYAPTSRSFTRVKSAGYFPMELSMMGGTGGAGGLQRRGSFGGMPSSSVPFYGDLPGFSQQPAPVKRYSFNRRGSTGSLGTNAMPLPISSSFGGFDMAGLAGSLPVLDLYRGFGGPVSQPPAPPAGPGVQWAPPVLVAGPGVEHKAFPMGYDVGAFSAMPGLDVVNTSMGGSSGMMPLGGMPMGFGGSFNVNTFPAATASNPLPFMGMQPSPPQNNMAMPMDAGRGSQVLDQYATTGPAPGYVDQGNGYVEEDM